MKQPPERVILRSCADRFGREIVLYEDTWYGHIVGEHAEMAGQIDELELTIAHAERVTQDQSFADRQCYYRNGHLPWPYDRDYLKVVVELEDFGVDRPLGGVVVTAYPVEAIPRREAPIW
jgi:hypothetical protein